MRGLGATSEPVGLAGPHVNASTFARAETDRMFAAVLADSGGVNRLNHSRAPSLDRPRAALLELAKRYPGFDGAFGARTDVDPERHLIGTAAGRGGLPSTEATDVNGDPGLPVGSTA